MNPQELLEILKVSAHLKTNTRHCYTENNRKESVADHSYRLALMAMLLSKEEEFTSVDMDKVIRMCLIHDLGEAFTGDIPTFEKNQEHEETEKNVLNQWVNGFPKEQREEWSALYEEMEQMQTVEARVYKALDKLEAVISHNESDISTWLPLEYDLQLTYGKEQVAFSPYLTELKAEIDRWTKKKIEINQ